MTSPDRVSDTMFHQDVRIAPREGDHVRLRPMRPGDYEFLYEAAIAPENSFRWRFRGAIPEGSEFAKSITNGVLVQFIVERRTTSEPLGLVTAYNANQREGWVYVAALGAPKYRASGLVVEGIGVLIGYLFTTWPFRKLYFEAIEYNTYMYASAYASLIVEEGRLQKHIFYDGRYWDLVTSAMYRKTWEELQEMHIIAQGNVDRPKALGHLEDIYQVSFTKNDVLSMAEFCNLLSDMAPECDGQIVPSARLIEDLGFDSLSMVELASVIDGLSGDGDLEMSAEVATVLDAYTWYSTACNMPQREQGGGQ